MDFFTQPSGELNGAPQSLQIGKPRMATQVCSGAPSSKRHRARDTMSHMIHARPARPGIVAACIALSIVATPTFADATPLAAEATDLPFSAFFATPIGPRGLEPTRALRAADGTRVRLVGYVAVQESPSPGRLLLAPRPVHLAEVADGDADDLPAATVSVRVPAGWSARASADGAGPVMVTGTLHVGREEAPDGRVTWVQLDAETPDAPALHASAEVSPTALLLFP